MLMHCLHHPDVELVMVAEGLGWVEVTPCCRYTVELALGLHRMSNFCCHCFTQNTSKTTKIFLFLLFYYHTDGPGPKLLIQDPLGELWVVVVQSLSCVPLFATPWTVAHRLPCLHYLPEFSQTYVHLVSDAIQPYHPLSPPSLPTLNLCQHQGPFQWVNSLHQMAKVWSFSFSINPSNEYSELISFRIDWFDLLAVQGTLKSLLHHHNLKASILGAQTWKGKKDMIPGDELWVIKSCLI